MLSYRLGTFNDFRRNVALFCEMSKINTMVNNIVYLDENIEFFPL